MRKLLFSFLLLAMLGCNDGGNATGTTGETGENPSAMDTTKHPDGTINGSVISTDTDAMTLDSVPR